MPEIGWCLIPPWVMAREDLTLMEKILFGRLLGLAKKEGYCGASNHWLGKQLAMKAKTIANTLTSLKEKGLVQTEYNGIKRRVYPLHPTGKSTSLVKEVPTSPDREVSIRVFSETESKLPSGVSPLSGGLSKYHHLQDLKPEDFEQIALDYKVSVGFVRLQWEKLQNYCASKGKTYKNYKSALRNFVLGDMQRAVERKADNKFRPIDASNV